MLKRHYLNNCNHSLKRFFLFLNLHKILQIFRKKDQLDRLNILQVIESDKCGYLNARKLLF